MTISGKYRFFEDGELVAEVDNVLTTAGKREILGMIAGTSGKIARLGLGVGNSAVSATDTTLTMPLVDVPVDFSVPLFGGASSKVVYKSRVDETISGVIYEIGCYNTPGGFRPLLINFGDADTDIAGPAGGNTSNDVRIGPTSPQITSTTPFTLVQQASAGDLLATDNIALAVKPASAVASVLTVVLTDVNNVTASKTYTLAANTNYQVVKHPVSAWTINTGFSWNDIASVSVTRDAAANNIILDGLSILAPGKSGTLLSHAVYGTGVVKRLGVRLDVEYELTFNLA